MQVGKCKESDPTDASTDVLADLWADVSADCRATRRPTVEQRIGRDFIFIY